MLVDEIVNYMSEKCRKIYNLETATLKEKLDNIVLKIISDVRSSKLFGGNND